MRDLLTLGPDHPPEDGTAPSAGHSQAGHSRPTPARARRFGDRRRRGSALIAILVIMVSVGLLIAGLSVYQAYFLRTIQGRGVESQNRSSSEGLARILVERLVAQGALNLGVLDAATVARMNDTLRVGGVLDSLATTLGEAITIDRDSTRYVLVQATDPASVTASSLRPLPSEGRTLQVTSDMPRRGFRTPPEPAGMLGVRVADVMVKAVVRSRRQSVTTSTAVVAFYKVPPWQHAFYSNADTTDLTPGTGTTAVVNGPVWTDGLLRAGPNGSGLTRVAGPVYATGGMLSDPSTLAVLTDGGYVGFGNNNMTRWNVQAGYPLGVPGVQTLYQGRVRIGGAVGAPLALGRDQNFYRGGRGECSDMQLNWPYVIPQRPDYIACNNTASYLPTAQMLSTNVANAAYGLTLGADAPAGYTSTLRGAISYWTYFPCVNPAGTPGGDRAGGTNIAFQADCGGEVAGARLWRGILADVRREAPVAADVPAGGARAQFTTLRLASNVFGYVVNLAPTAGLVPATGRGAFLSFRQAVDPRARPGQEGVVLRNGACLAGPLTIHSQDPVYVVGDFNLPCSRGAGLPATSMPALIDAPLVTVLPGEAGVQMLDTVGTTSRWDAPLGGRPWVMRAYGDVNGEVAVNAVIRARYQSGTVFNSAVQQVPSVLGDWGRVTLRVRGAIDAQQAGLYRTDGTVVHPNLYVWSNVQANSVQPGAVIQPQQRVVTFETALLTPSFQPPGSWMSGNIPTVPADGAWPGSTRTRARQANAWWGGYSLARLSGGYVTSPGLH